VQSGPRDPNWDFGPDDCHKTGQATVKTVATYRSCVSYALGIIIVNGILMNGSLAWEVRIASPSDGPKTAKGVLLVLRFLENRLGKLGSMRDLCAARRADGDLE
jgi:hypothetical protein